VRPIRSVVRLGWTARPEATYYVVRIRRARGPATAPVLELWTARPNVAVGVGRGTSGQDGIAPGTYRWTVHPVTTRRVGEMAPAERPIAQGAFTIAAP
jgi:hypothetical protein